MRAGSGDWPRERMLAQDRMDINAAELAEAKLAAMDHGIEHEWDDARSGEAWQQGPVILAWPGVVASGGWEGYNLVIHELAHKLDMLDGTANGLPPLHRDMRVLDWANAMQTAYERMNAELDADPEAHTCHGVEDWNRGGS